MRRRGVALLLAVAWSGLDFAQPRALPVLVPVARGSDAVTVTCLTDVLTRAGANVTLASAEKTLRLNLGGLTVVADTSLANCEGVDWAAIACPGGEQGAERLADSRPLLELLRRQRKQLRVLAAVGESPAELLAEHQLLEFDEKATCLPNPRLKKVIGAACAGWWDAAVVVDRKVVTSQGPGTALACALKIVELLYGAPKAKELSSQLLST
ncbi:unnamed protein product [Effrenium voratum]|uniref:DJ-1/PfpI domain-containing protein n=1 Tax=Effrenium voratum TaxID=2562239 RepID=A0AA36HYC1_9DINO|nr:unnamed protein product [Effrenium voratum]CAJ1431110.1 unnamed protein product [Effrenium voratum]